MKITALFILLLITASAYSQIDTTAYFSPSLTITKGGHYSGNFRSDNPNIPAITISNGTPGDTVFLENVYVVSAGDCIRANGGATIVIENYRADCLNPVGSAQRKWGFFAYQPRYIRMQHYFLNHTGGIRIQDKQYTTQLLIRYGIQKNTDRRNGYGKVSGTSIAPGLQIMNNVGLVNSEIAWIYCENTSNESYVEDNFNIYNSGGTAASPLQIHDVCVNGAYPFPADSLIFSGTGITMDGNNKDAATTCQYVNVTGNTFIRTMNAAMNLPTGHDIHYEKNRIVNSGYILQNGVKKYLPMSWSAIANWDKNKAGAAGMYNNTIQNNFIGYYSKNVFYKYANRQDENQQSGSFLLPHGLNQYFSDREITSADEDLEIASFWQKAKSTGVTIGVTYRGQETASAQPTDTIKFIPCAPVTITIHDTIRYPVPVLVLDTTYRDTGRTKYIRDTVILYRVPLPQQYEWTPIKPTGKVIKDRVDIWAKKEEIA